MTEGRIGKYYKGCNRGFSKNRVDPGTLSTGWVFSMAKAEWMRRTIVTNALATVLFGAQSFWEGVDIQGDALSVVIIAKLPFDVPSDPVIAARAATFENSFGEYSLPEAILKFRQGFGRLIRSKSDRGLVVIMDNRINTKRYGQDFINSIPSCTRDSGSVRNLPYTAEKWLKRQMPSGGN